MGLSTDTGTTNGGYINDCYGSLTQTAGTAITRVIPPREGARACVGNFKYVPAATAHTITMMVVLAEVTVISEAAASQAVVSLSAIPTAADGSILAANDYLILQYEDGSWNAHLVSSLSGTAVTVGTSFSQKIPKSSRAFFMGAPADHTSRQFLTIASTAYDFVASDFRIRAATSALPNQPILVHSNNATNAGNLHHLSYYYD